MSETKSITAKNGLGADGEVFDSLVNQGEYLPAFYLSEILPKQLRGGLLKEWSEQERQGNHTPRQGLRDLTGPYQTARAALFDDAEKYNSTADRYAVAAQEAAAQELKSLPKDEEPPVARQPVPGPDAWAQDGSPEGAWRSALHTWHVNLLRALGFDATPVVLTARGAGGLAAVPLAHAEEQLVVLSGGFATTVETALSDTGANRLPAPVRVASGKHLTTVTDLASWLFSNAANPPRYALLLFGGVMILADRDAFPRGRHLAVSLDVALPRKGAKGSTAGELDVIAALFRADALRPKDDGSEDDIARFLAESRDHSVSVTADLRHGLQKSVQLIANEVLDLAREQGVRPEDLAEWLPHDLKEPGDLPKLLTTESLRYLYRILFLLYAEARTDLGILPMKSEEYRQGYSVARLRELVVPKELTGHHARTGYHFHDSLDLLFEKVYTGHPVADTQTTRDAATAAPEPTESVELAADDGHIDVRIEALRSKLFDPTSIKLVGRRVPWKPLGDEPGTTRPPLDLRLRNKTLHQVLRNLTLVEGKGKFGRGGFISYAQLGINQLGAVYEGLMSYTGFIAEEALYEVAKGGDPKDGSWLITSSQVNSGRYPDEPGHSVFVKDRPDPESDERVSRVHPVGSYVYRLAGRDRQTSASYYTPESLTKATVEQALRFRLHPEGKIDPAEPEAAEVIAAEVLKWRVCEPALGSGAFLNEAVNQLAELYLRLAKRDTGQDIDADNYLRELQKVKAYIALHNSYGVDLNDTAVELAEISLWLNTMYQGMKAPWYGLHLHRGNSLVGASRKTYPGNALAKGEWLKTKGQRAPDVVPLAQTLPGQAVHQFLLPSLGWGSVADDVRVRKPKKGEPEDKLTSVVAGADAEWLDADVIEAMKAWRSQIRRAPRGGSGSGKKPVAAKSAAARKPKVTLQVDDEQGFGQGALDLPGVTVWEQQGLGFDDVLSGGEERTPRPTLGAQRGIKAVRSAKKVDDKAAQDEEDAQVGRLMALAQRVEYLWNLVVKRLRLSEQEIARGIDVWGADSTMLAERREGAGGKVMDRDAVRKALEEEGRPYWRLKQVMDAWCALWFWPLEEVGLLNGTDPCYFAGERDLTKIKKGYDGRRTALKNLDDWIEFAEAVLGRVGVESGKKQVSLDEVRVADSLEKLDKLEGTLEEQMRRFSVWMEPYDLGDRFPWYETSYRIAEERGFFHWELSLAHVFAEGGFDVMVGNPPWVRQEWDENAVLAELEPWFELGGKAAEERRAEHVGELLRDPVRRSFYLGELETVAGVSAFLASLDTYPELVGTRPDMYRAFMLLAWRATGQDGIAGLVHPSTHLTGAKEGALRRAAYEHLRLHADFVNELKLFPSPVGNASHFSVNIYGNTRNIGFEHLSWLMHPQVLTRSLRHDGKGVIPGIKNNGVWDLRPHLNRVVTVERATLIAWQKLAGEENSLSVDETKLLFPVTAAEESAISALAKWPHRLGGLDPRISSGFNEKTDRTAGYIEWNPSQPTQWSEVILQGSFLLVATPLGKQPPVGGSRSHRDYFSWDLSNLGEDAVPRTNYRPAGARSRYIAAQDRWVDPDRLAQLKADPAAMHAAGAAIDAEQPGLEAKARDLAIEALLREASERLFAQSYRVAWREMIASDTERSLFASLIPPGVNHVHAVRSAVLPTPELGALVAGFFASLPLDYALRISGRGHLDVSDAATMPAPTLGHPLAPALLLRTLRLNCQTNAYASFWNRLYDGLWTSDTWAAASEWPSDAPPLTQDLGPTWTSHTPLRTDFSRRAALVEIDALVAVWLGIDADELIAMYRSRFPVLQQYEENMWFDATGRRIAKAHQVHGYGQPKDAWKQLSSPPAFPLEATVPEGYTGPLYRARREDEMRAAHAEFTRRLRAAGWEPGMSTAPDGAASNE
ncbi:Eco57I restriction-modification methylase domain-containing protein [Streptomyces sp. N35]|uniref:Eco57I restriction-modification methylase domain-containing protein n=1 Tax=Streptomyces sp. N35 TaxID=2795730 RepID=UPI0018F7B30A|nr:DNA methyltransferase [Streptomyces sp. N35]